MPIALEGASSIHYRTGTRKVRDLLGEKDEMLFLGIFTHNTKISNTCKANVIRISETSESRVARSFETRLVHHNCIAILLDKTSNTAPICPDFKFPIWISD